MKHPPVLSCVLGIILLVSSGPATGQTEAKPSTAAEAAPVLEWSPDSGVLQSLESLQRALSLKEAEAADLQQQLAAASDDLAREDLRRRLQEVRNAIEDQRRQFDGFAVDVDLSPFTPQTESKFDWQEQVGKLLEPILAEFENATAETRVIGQIRTQLNSVRKRRTSRRKPSTIWRRCWAGRLHRNCKRA